MDILGASSALLNSVVCPVQLQSVLTVGPLKRLRHLVRTFHIVNYLLRVVQRSKCPWRTPTARSSSAILFVDIMPFAPERMDFGSLNRKEAQALGLHDSIKTRACNMLCTLPSHKIETLHSTRFCGLAGDLQSCYASAFRLMQLMNETRNDP